MSNKETELQELKVANDKLIDHNNELRLQGLKDWQQIRTDNQEMKQAAEEFINLENKQINYQVQNSILLREKIQLEKQIKTAQDRIERLYKLKGLPTNPTTINWTNLLVNGLLIAGFIYLIWPTKKNHDY